LALPSIQNNKPSVAQTPTMPASTGPLLQPIRPRTTSVGSRNVVVQNSSGQQQRVIRILQRPVQQATTDTRPPSAADSKSKKAPDSSVNQ